MSSLDLGNFLRQEARKQLVSDSELARRAKISRTALLKILTGEVQHPTVRTLANLAYALDYNPHHLVSLYLAGTSSPPRGAWLRKGKNDSSHFIRDITFPDGDLVSIGQKFLKKWEIANRGQLPWVGRKLVCQDQNSVVYRKLGDSFAPLHYSLVPDSQEIAIPNTLPGNSVTLEVEFMAPTTPAWVVSYWKMVDENGSLCFPEMEGLRCCVSVIAV
ncbi:MAG: NBR1-Ig-like domain-containing protein [Undibacterium umbellatum]|uniref:NBR1-Ig-like domain-containing protein n=1 Tax=Undibacterium umbellatum TaxID=2762300 RepID=UPI003BB788B6